MNDKDSKHSPLITAVDRGDTWWATSVKMWTSVCSSPACMGVHAIIFSQTTSAPVGQITPATTASG